MDQRNLVALFNDQASASGPADRFAALKNMDFIHDVSWAAYHEQVQACASALVEAGIRPGDRVGLWAENRVEWLIADMAIMAAGAINVPPHAPLTARQICFQFQETGIRWLFVSTMSQFDKVIQIRGELPDLKGVVIFDGWEERQGDKENKPGLPVGYSWDGFLQRGRLALDRNRDELASRAANLGPDDLATIMYTSGTTGNPKGVMLTHGNLLSNAWGSNQVSPREEGAVAPRAGSPSVTSMPGRWIIISACWPP